MPGAEAQGAAAATSIGWVASVPPNGRMNRALMEEVENNGLATEDTGLESKIVILSRVACCLSR